MIVDYYVKMTIQTNQPNTFNVGRQNVEINILILCYLQ